MKKVFIDSDVFVLDLRYPRDRRMEVNKHFLKKVRSKRIRGVTSIFNLLEVCGILSFNLSTDQLVGLYADFCRHFAVQILFPADKDAKLDYRIAEIFMQIQKKQCLGDAQIASVVERFGDQLSCFATWNQVDFTGRLSIPVKSPAEI